jgi:hypothetical protein
VADVSTKAVWAHAPGFSLQLVGGGVAPRFELLEDADGQSHPSLSPDVLTATFPDSDEVTMRLGFKDKRPLAFNWATIVQPAERFLGWLHLLPWEHSLAFDLTCGDQLHVLRPRDLLSLTFEFENMRLHTGIQPVIAPNHFGGINNPTHPDVGDQGCPARSPHQGPNLRCRPNGGPPRVTVIFPPQHVAEEAYFRQENVTQEDVDLPDVDLRKVPLPQGTPYSPAAAKKVLDPDMGATNESFPPPPVVPPKFSCQSRMSGPSRLVFTLPEHHDDIQLKVEYLLNWSQWTPSLAPVATYAGDLAKASAAHQTPPPKPQIAEPTGLTSIELPYRLMISPNENGRWAHAPTPVDFGTDVFELWHTRLGVKIDDAKGSPIKQRHNRPTVDESATNNRSIRAVWSPDYTDLRDPRFLTSAPSPPSPFRMSLGQFDRNQIVHLTSNFNIIDAAPQHAPFLPSDVHVDQLILTSMGGWLKSYGVWDPPLSFDPATGHYGPQFTLQQWKHAATMGRDHYVRVVYKGYLLPFGHRASLVKVTERRFDQATSGDQNGKTFALLHQRMFVVVQKPRKDFPMLGQQYAGRGFPFKRIDALTLVTPDIIDPNSETTINAGLNQSLFWVIVDANRGPFPFRFRFWDYDGGVSEADVYVMFASANVAQDSSPNGASRAAGLFDASGPDAWRMSLFNGQKVAFAPSSKPGNTTYEVKDMVWRANSITSPGADVLYAHDLPCFYPSMDRADVTSSAVKRVTPQSASSQVCFFPRVSRLRFRPESEPWRGVSRVMWWKFPKSPIWRGEQQCG